jgi:predicted GIY-YIG superfamily endonuclease
MDQQLLAVMTILVSTVIALIVRAHLLDIVIGVIRVWNWLITLPEPVSVRDELRKEIVTHVNQQVKHYLKDKKLGSAESAIRLFEWQIASAPVDIRAAVTALAVRVASHVNHVVARVLNREQDNSEERISFVASSATAMIAAEGIKALLRQRKFTIRVVDPREMRDFEVKRQPVARTKFRHRHACST